MTPVITIFHRDVTYFIFFDEDFDLDHCVALPDNRRVGSRIAYHDLPFDVKIEIDDHLEPAKRLVQHDE